MLVRAMMALIILQPLSLSAQKDEYLKRAEQIAQEVWGEKDPAFQNNLIPDEFKNESAVILAKKYDIDAASRSKFKVGILTMGTNKEIVYRYCLREKVKIQDKVALEDFSEINYQRLNKRSNSFMLIKMRDKQVTFIGARIHKTDGSTREVRMDESVAIKNEKDSKENKLAIPDLQVGDILDFYIQTEAQLELTPLDPFEFLLASDYPILNYTIKGNVSKKYAIEYRNANMAPDFKISRDDDDDFVFLLNKLNLPKITASQWYSGYRQLPYIKLHIFLGEKKSSRERFKRGEISKGLTEAELFEDIKSDFSQYSLFVSMKQIPMYNEVRSGLNDLFKEYEKKSKAEMDEKKKIAFIYSYLRYKIYFSPTPTDAIVVDKDRNSFKANDKYFAYSLSLLLKNFDVPNELIIVSGRYSPLLKDYISTDEPEYLVHTTGDNNLFLADDGILTNFGLLPGEYEGEKAYTLKLGSKKGGLEEGSVVLPISKAAANVRLEKLLVDIKLENSPILKIKRNVSSTGLYKKDDQTAFLYFEDYYNSLKNWLGENKSFLEEFEDKKRGKSLADEYRTAFIKAKSNEKDYYQTELKNKYGIDPKEILSYKIDSMGDLPETPMMEFTTEFTIADWLKKAGNNYIFEIGKLVGVQSSVNETERKRNADIYMPFARTLAHNIVVNIPAGYSVEGLEALQRDVNNETGYFKAKATLQGDKLFIEVTKQYSHNFDPAANWNKILAFMDAANDFTNVKVLLRKK